MNIKIIYKKFKSPYDVIKSSWILIRYIRIFQIMKPSNLLKSDFEPSVTFEPLGIFLCCFHCCAKENGLYHFKYVLNIGDSLSFSISSSFVNGNCFIDCRYVSPTVIILSIILIDWLIDWSIDWLADGLIDWSTDRLIDWLIDFCVQVRNRVAMVWGAVVGMVGAQLIGMILYSRTILGRPWMRATFRGKTEDQINQLQAQSFHTSMLFCLLSQLTLVLALQYILG